MENEEPQIPHILELKGMITPGLLHLKKEILECFKDSHDQD